MATLGDKVAALRLRLPRVEANPDIEATIEAMEEKVGIEWPARSLHKRADKQDCGRARAARRGRGRGGGRAGHFLGQATS